MRPAFQHQGPKSNCVIAARHLGWVSCTAYAMAMLIDAATDGARRPKGCRVRRLVKPRDIVEGLTLSQVADVAEARFGVQIAVRTGSNAITVESALKRLRGGRGFVLQGNNLGWGKHEVNHAIYVHALRGGTAANPAEALVYDPQRQHERWIAWPKVLGFAAALRFDDGRRLGEGLFYAGFAPKPMTPAEHASRGATIVDDGVELVFGATRLPRPDRTRANPPPGRMVNVRSTPKRLSRSTVVETLADGALFTAYQKTRGIKPPGAASATWFGNRDGTWWIHVSGLRKVGGST